jgi:putative oxidoreductase
MAVAILARMQRFLERHIEVWYGLLRFAAGLMFAFHGWQKLFGVLSERSGPAPFTQMWIGGIIETVCGSLVALGLATRWAAFLASGTMAVAYVQFHWKLSLGAGFWPIVNRGELALLYALLFLFIAARGPGRLSLDARR